MTKASLAHATVEELENMTNEQLLTYFAPVLHITRPERVVAVTSSGKTATGYKSKASSVDIELAKAREALRQAGLEGIL